jgi:quercetin dioxygenase-like cupin family protein
MIGEHSPEEGHDLAALYVLGVLDGDEAREFEQHLASGCATCVAEIEAFAPVVAELGYSAPPQTPSAEVRTRVLARIAAEGLSANHPVIEKDGVRFVRSAALTWREANAPAVEVKPLSRDRHRGYLTYLVRMAPGAALRPHRHADVEESYVIEGDLLVSGVCMQAGDYCRAEPGSVHAEVTTQHGCVFIAVCSERDELLA